jgi:hypothetical protein
VVIDAVPLFAVGQPIVNLTDRHRLSAAERDATAKPSRGRTCQEKVSDVWSSICRVAVVGTGAGGNKGLNPNGRWNTARGADKIMK